MPREIDCPDCEGQGYYYKTPEDRLYPRNIGGLKTKCTNRECKDGKITVYTQEELNKAVQEEMDKYKQSGLAQFKNRKMYSLLQLNKAVEVERRDIIDIFNYEIVLPPGMKEMFIAAIKARSNT